MHGCESAEETGVLCPVEVTDETKVYVRVASSGYRQDSPPRGDSTWAKFSCGHVEYYGEDGPSTPIPSGYEMVCRKCTHTRRQMFQDTVLKYWLRLFLVVGGWSPEWLKQMG